MRMIGVLGADQRADIDIAIGHNAAHRGVDLGLRQPDLQLAQFGFGLLLLRFGELHLGVDDGQPGLAGIIVLGREELFVEQLLGPFQFGANIFALGPALLERRPRYRDTGAGPVDLLLQLVVVEFGDQGPAFDGVADLEVEFLDAALSLRADIDGFFRFEGSGQQQVLAEQANT